MNSSSAGMSDALKFIKGKHTYAVDMADNSIDIDSLPYIDSWTDDLKKQAITLVEAELKSISLASEHPDLVKYLEVQKHKPKVVSSVNKNETLWYRVLQNLQSNEKHCLGIPADSYAVPPDDCEDVSVWKSAIIKKKAEIWNTKIHLVNAQLALEFAEPAWLKYLDSLSSIADRCKRSRESVNEDIGSINKQRKLAQVTKGNELRLLAHDIEILFKKNRQALSHLYKLNQTIQQLEEET